MKRFRDLMADCCGFSRDETAILKGLSILLMIAHHLYGMYGVQVDDALQYSEIVQSFAWKGKVCVLLFFFVTGYGYCCLAEKDGKPWLLSVRDRLKHFYPVFLVMLAIETLLLGCFGHLQARPLTEYAGSWRGYLLCAMGLVDVYADYWYIGVFLCGAMVMYPLLRWGRQRGAAAECLVFMALAAVCLAMATMGLSLKVSYHVLTGSLPTVFLIVESPWFSALSWMGGFLMGWACASVYIRRSFSSWVLLLLGVLTCYLSQSCILLPMLICLPAVKLLSRCGSARAVLGKLGALSAVMWLNHRLIFGYWFADFFYSVPAPLNFLLLVVLSALAAQVFIRVYAWVGGKLSHIFASLGGRCRESGATRP